MIMRNFIYLSTLLFFSSCATLILKKDYGVHVYTDLPNAKAEIRDSVYNLPADIKIRRSKDDLGIKLFADSLEKAYLVKASPNATFLYWNLICCSPILPVVYGVDFTNHKRFYYGRSIYLNPYDTTGIIRPRISKNYYDYWTKNFPTRKGQLNFTLSLPWVNSFYLHPDQESVKINTGFMGISAGLEFFYKENKYIALTGSAVSDFLSPLPVAADFSGEVENMTSVYTSITDNFKFRRFTLGYGINFSRNTWMLVYHDRFDPPAPTRDPATKSSNSFGFTFDGYHQVGKHFFVGLIYRPTLLNVYPGVDFKYEHLVSMDFRWKFKVIK
jgi:hypothetical protein